MYDKFGNWIDDGSGGAYQIDTGDLSAGDPGYGWQYFSDGTTISPSGEYYYNGELVWSPNSSSSSIWDSLSKMLGSGATALKNAFIDKNTGQLDLRSLAATAGGLYGLYQSNKPQEKTGYQGGIPKYEAVREAVQGSQYDPNRRPGSGGQRYFSNTTYAAPGEAATAARTAAKEEAAGLEALNKANPANQRRPDPAVVAAEKGAASEVAREGEDASKVTNNVPVPKYAHGGITALAQGRYLGGATDGMADKIPARIDGNQEAKLSHGEFVIPADVVSHLGNGNSEAGAERLYAMMDKIRKARTGTTKQGKQINPDKFLAA